MKRASGFTLVEILVALTMFAVVGGALLQLYQGGLQATRKSAEHGHAALLARSKLTELLSYNNLHPGVLSGRFNDGYRWQATLTQPENVEDLRAGVLEPLNLRLIISWGPPEEESSFQLDSMTLTQASEL